MQKYHWLPAQRQGARLNYVEE